MSVKLTITINPAKWKTGEQWRRFASRNLKRAMAHAMSVLHGRIRRNLSGPSHTLFPGNGNPFPGTLSGRMKNSVHAKMTTGGTGVGSNAFLRGVVGPNTNYAEYQDWLRPYLQPSLDAEEDRIRAIFDDAVGASL